MKAVLTSTGFDNDNIKDIFVSMIDKEMNEVMALFVPAALTQKQQAEYAQCFFDDLIKAGILAENIDTYTLQSKMSIEQAKKYDVMYFSGGDPKLLMDKIRAVHFESSIKAFVDNGGIYFGASAGSDIVTNAIEDNLGYLNIIIQCHDKVGSKPGNIDKTENQSIKISDNQAIIIDGDKIHIAE